MPGGVRGHEFRKGSKGVRAKGRSGKCAPFCSTIVHSVYHRQTEARKILVEGEAGDIFKGRFNKHIGDGVAKGKSLVLTQKAENPFGLPANRIIVFKDAQGRFDFIQKTDGRFGMKTVKEQSRSFTDDIPGGLQGYFLFHGLIENLARPPKVDILGTEGCKEKGSVAECLMTGKFDHGFVSG
jgi:hypothetical protein